MGVKESTYDCAGCSCNAEAKNVRVTTSDGLQLVLHASNAAIATKWSDALGTTQHRIAMPPSREGLDEKLAAAALEVGSSVKYKVRTYQVVLMKMSKVHTSLTKLADEFNEADMSGSGWVDLRELSQMLRKLGLGTPPPPDVLETLFTASDMKSRDKLDFQEFALLVAILLLLRLITPRNQDEEAIFTQLYDAYALGCAAFVLFDKDSDGRLTQEEVSAMVDQHTGAALFHEMDWDSDGSVTFREFLFAFMSWAGVTGNADDRTGEKIAETKRLVEAVHRVGGQHRIISYPAILLKMPKLSAGFMKIRAECKKAGTSPYLSADEFSAVLHALGIEPADPDAAARLSQVVIQETGGIEFLESIYLIATIVLTEELTPSDHAQEAMFAEMYAIYALCCAAFTLFDKDKDGCLTQEEVSEDMDAQTGASLFREMDWDADGEVTFKEFLFAFVAWAGANDDEEEEEEAAGAQEVASSSENIFL
jgi:calcium-binding protein CML